MNDVFQVILVPSVNSITQDVFELYKKYQIVVHRDPPEKPTFKQFERFLVKSPLKVIFLFAVENS